MNDTATYIMIGGFLGAGKSTSILALARRLSDRGLKVGLITNDQGHGLVDTLKVANHGFAVEEIPGGCFCCRFNSLMEAADKLTRATRPDVFIAEPVGSCTDLVASVSYPLRRIYGDRFTVAPLSVVVDPLRAFAMLGLEGDRRFSPKVAYIYMKQLEEAAQIVINKVDLISAEQREQLRACLAQSFPNARVLEVSARSGAGLDDWFALLEQEQQPGGPTMEVDYRIYAEGEALLGWLNATVAVRADRLVDGERLLHLLAEDLRAQLNQDNAEIAHLKMTLEPSDGSGELAVINLVGNSYRPEFSQSLSDPLDAGQLIVNLRAEGTPELLETCLRQALAHATAILAGLELELEHFESFKPGEPKPIYRFAHDNDTIATAEEP